MKFNILIIIILICIYHITLQNGLEKIFSQTYFNYDAVKRPLPRCSDCDYCRPLKCIGMPSGHAETVTLFSTLLYLYKYLPLWACVILVIIVSGQRITSQMHTLDQVIVGIFFGYMYALLYKYFNLSYKAFLIVFGLGLLLAISCVYIIEKEISKPVPNWVDPVMMESIKKKQNVPFYHKVGTIYTNAVIQEKTFINWKETEICLDKIIEKIKNSGKKYDAIVGLKTGGAIICDYVSLKLGIPNYKIKISKSDYNCNKKHYNIINDIISIELDIPKKYIVCEGININLEGKNVILIDELVTTGTTINEAYKYLKYEKKVNDIYTTSISFYEDKNKYSGDIPINYVIPNTTVIWGWGYDN